MLENVKAWIVSHPGVRFDSRAFMACLFDLNISKAEETMFLACWNMVTIPGQVGAATAPINEATEKAVIVVVQWHDCNSHVITYHAAAGVARRFAGAVRHDLGRMFSRRFF